jgi:hypothetical protein
MEVVFGGIKTKALNFHHAGLCNDCSTGVCIRRPTLRNTNFDISRTKAPLLARLKSNKEYSCYFFIHLSTTGLNLVPTAHEYLDLCTTKVGWLRRIWNRGPSSNNWYKLHPMPLRISYFQFSAINLTEGVKTKTFSRDSLGHRLPRTTRRSDLMDLLMMIIIIMISHLIRSLMDYVQYRRVPPAPVAFSFRYGGTHQQ